MTLQTEFTPATVEGLLELAASRKAEGWRFIQLLAVNTENGIDLIYSFAKDNLLVNHEIKGIKKGTTVPSITDQFIAAFVFENETHDLFGVDISNIAIDFKGNFYSLAHKEPMTIISPAQKAAREKAAKIAAAKAEKERAAAAANAAFVEDHPEAATRKTTIIEAPGDDGLELKLAGMDPEKVARARAALAAKAKKGLEKSDAEQQRNEKIANLDPEKAAKVKAALEAKAAREKAASEKEGE